MHSLICVLQVRFSCSTQINLSNKELSHKCVLQEAALEYFDNKPRINYSLKLADTKISSHPLLPLEPRILKAWIKIRYLNVGTDKTAFSEKVVSTDHHLCVILESLDKNKLRVFSIELA